MTVLGKQIDDETAKKVGATFVSGLLIAFFIWVATQVSGAQNSDQVDQAIDLKLAPLDEKLEDIRDRTIRIEDHLLGGSE